MTLSANIGIFEQNQLGTDWHFGFWDSATLVLDDISGGLDKLRQDGLRLQRSRPVTAFTFIFTEKDRQMLNETEWNPLNSYLIGTMGLIAGLTLRTRF